MTAAEAKRAIRNAKRVWIEYPTDHDIYLVDTTKKAAYRLVDSLENLDAVRVNHDGKIVTFIVGV